MRTRDMDKVDMVKQKAIEMLVSDGFEGFSMNRLAKACSISVATLYIYYKDKDDLVTTLAIEEGRKMNSIILGGFDPALPFAVGMKMQWTNRLKYMMEHPKMMLFFEQLRSSSYHEKVFASITGDFREIMGKFLKNAVDNGQINKMSVEVYWAVAFAPLYTLIRFHQEGTSLGGRPFAIKDKLVWETFDLVLKAFKT